MIIANRKKTLATVQSQLEAQYGDYAITEEDTTSAAVTEQVMNSGAESSISEKVQPGSSPSPEISLPLGSNSSPPSLASFLPQAGSTSAPSPPLETTSISVPSPLPEVILPTASTSAPSPTSEPLPGIHSPQTTTPGSLPSSPRNFLTSSEDDEYQPYIGKDKYLEIDSADETMKLLTPKGEKECEYNLFQLLSDY
jgi:hypothetical protein